MARGHSLSGAPAALLLWCLLFAAPFAAAEQRLFWQAESADGTIYLLGSLHFGDPAMYPLPPAIVAALAGSDALAVEIDITAHDPEILAGMISRRGLYHDGRRLADVVDESTWQALLAVAGEVGLPAALLERQKPWFASMTLTTLALARRGWHSELGVDLHVMKLAAGHGLPIVELESIEQQLELLDGLSGRGQLDLLAQALEQVTETDRHFRQLLDAWLAGDAAALDDILIEELRTEGDGELHQALLVDRNRSMLRDIVRIHGARGTLFVVVGAGHLVGADGIVAGLADAGYRVARPTLDGGGAAAPWRPVPEL